MRPPGRGNQDVATRTWSPGRGNQDVTTRTWPPGRGLQDIATRTWQPGLGRRNGANRTWPPGCGRQGGAIRSRHSSWFPSCTKSCTYCPAQRFTVVKKGAIQEKLNFVKMEKKWSKSWWTNKFKPRTLLSQDPSLNAGHRESVLGLLSLVLYTVYSIVWGGQIQQALMELFRPNCEPVDLPPSHHWPPLQRL